MNTWLRFFCPLQNRDFPGKRWVKIALRTVHLIGVAGVGGGVLMAQPLESWQAYLHLTLTSGFCYLLLELWTNAIMLIQIRGLVVMVKLALLCALLYAPDQAYWLVLIIVLSSVVSHAPGKVRYFSVLHGRRVESL